jgi:hypothetical protein
MTTLFPNEHGATMAKEIDEKISSLPGLQGINVMHRFAEKAARSPRNLL